VIVFAALHSARASRLRGRRPSRVPAGDVQPEPVPITRVTVIAAEPFRDDAAAREWLEGCRSSGDTGAGEVADALVHVNRAIGAYRVSAADARAHDVTREQAARIRIGYGSGARLVDGGWEECIVMPEEHGRPRVRRKMLAPEQEVAGILTGRSSDVQPSEELLLRARLDLDAGRNVAAALQLRIAAEALRAELAREDAADASLDSRVATATGLSEAALSGELTAAQAERLESLVNEFERAVRRRRYAGTE
jgi:hypothetical protein